MRLILSICLALIAAPALPEAPQSVAPLSEAPLAVGRLNGHCSAVLVSDTRALTAAHCVLDGSQNPLTPGTLTFFAAPEPGERLAGRSPVLGVALHPGLLRDGVVQHDNGRLDPRHDIAVLELARRMDLPPLPLGWYGQEPRLRLIGYPRGADSARHDATCAARPLASGLVLDCPVVSGLSGSPVLAGPEARVVGITVASIGGGGALAAELDDWVMAQVSGQ